MIIIKHITSKLITKSITKYCDINSKMSLVADYGDSSGSDSESSTSDTDSSENSNSPIESEISAAAPTEKLPTPDFIETSTTTANLPKTSVFTNPFKEAENAKQAILEKHVKMVNSQDNVRIINGKKVCWNYRKGRCRFGHNCIYAHDSDVQKSKEQLEAENQIQTTVLYQSQQYSKPISEEATTTEETETRKKKRPGLTQGLVPGKKVMKAYRDQHVKVVPNTSKK